MLLVGEMRMMDAEGEAGAGSLAVVYSRTSNLAGFLVAMLADWGLGMCCWVLGGECRQRMVE